MIRGVEITPSSAPSSFWIHGSTTTHEISGANEVQSSDNQVVWALGQRKLDSNVDSSNSSHCNPIAHVEGIWPSPPLLNFSLKLYPDSTCERELVPKQPLPSPYSPSVTSKSSSDLIQHDQLEKGNKTDISLGCRIFGINLKTNSSIVSSSEKKPSCTTSVADGAKDSVAAAATTSQVDAGNLSQPSKEQPQPQVASELSTKGTQTKHVSNLSSRTRTKV